MTENRFNARLSLFLRRSKIHYAKISDRTTVGISDFLIWHEGCSVGLEVKRVLTFPKKDTAKLLHHPFSKPQLRFLKNMRSSGNLGYGLISVHEAKTMYLIEPEQIPESGNWSVSDFKAASTSFVAFEMNDFKALFRGMFYGNEQINRIIQ